MTDYSELKRLAEAVNEYSAASSDGMAARIDFQEHVKPAAVLALIAENEKLTAHMALRKRRIDSDNECLAAAAVRIDELEAEVKALRLRIGGDEKKLDALLAHCDDGECVTCGQIICPHGDGMHFHHDGCPTCAQEDDQ